MNEIIICFILLIVIIIIYNKQYNNFVANINDEMPQYKNDTVFYKKIVNDLPALRGYIKDYRLNEIYEEGGSKPFMNIIINNDNLIANQVNYNKYESYRRKPCTIKKYLVQ